MKLLRNLIGFLTLGAWIVRQVWTIPYNVVAGTLFHFLPHQKMEGYIDSVNHFTMSWRATLYSTYHEVILYGADMKSSHLAKAIHLAVR